MPKKYCNTFRKLVVNYYKKYKNVRNVLSIFKVSNGSLFNWINNTNTKKIVHTRKSKVTPQIKCYIKMYIMKRVNFNYKLLLKNINRNFNISISKTTLYNTIHKLKITRKKIYKRYIYKKPKLHKKEIIEFTKNIKMIEKKDIISIDECHFDNTLYTNYGWSQKGQKIFLKHHICKKERYTLICAINNNKVIDYKIIKNSANGEIYLEFIKSICSKVKNKILLMDNARIHHYHKLKEYMKSNSNKILYNVPYMPEYNPIEKCFSIIKNKIKRNKSEINLKEKIIKEIKNIKSCYLKKIYINTFKDF